MNKTAIISGAGGALGGAVVDAFLRQGYQVEALFHGQVPARDETTFRGHQVDLLDEGAVQQTVDDIANNQQPIDVLVCTAGGFAPGSLADTSTADLEKQYRLNFLTAYHLAKPVYEKMKAQGYGYIFLIGSRQGLDSTASTGAVAYGLSKSMLFNLAAILNADSKGTVVTSMIVPSTIDTPANRKAMPDADFHNWVAPADIADIILFYCSDKAKAIRQPVIRVYGDA